MLKMLITDHTTIGLFFVGFLIWCDFFLLTGHSEKFLYTVNTFFKM